MIDACTDYHKQFPVLVMPSHAYPCRVTLQLLVAVSLCLLHFALVDAQSFASCSGDVCAGQSSFATGTDGVVRCCTSGHISGQATNVVYCSQQQDCSQLPQL